MIKIADLQRLSFEREWARLAEKERLLNEREQKLRAKDYKSEPDWELPSAGEQQSSAEGR